MLTKTDIKLIQSLSKRRGREEHRLFVCEGHKLIKEMLGAYFCEALIATEESYRLIIDVLGSLGKQYRPKRIELVEPSFDFRRISSMVTPQPMLALFRIPEESALGQPLQSDGLAILLDDVQDPGNVGTIIRTADWFGIRHIYMTQGSADPYAPKVVQATMGALGRVKVCRLKSLEALAEHYRGAIYGTFLSGENIYTIDALPESALLVLGNEGNGISPAVEQLVDRRLTIPCLASGSQGSESLNVSIAAAVCMSELQRRRF